MMTHRVSRTYMETYVATITLHKAGSRFDTRGPKLRTRVQFEVVFSFHQRF